MNRAKSRGFLDGSQAIELRDSRRPISGLFAAGPKRGESVCEFATALPMTPQRVQMPRAERFAVGFATRVRRELMRAQQLPRREVTR